MFIQKETTTQHRTISDIQNENNWQHIWTNRTINK
jgi:hypothetical protein